MKMKYNNIKEHIALYEAHESATGFYKCIRGCNPIHERLTKNKNEKKIVSGKIGKIKDSKKKRIWAVKCSPIATRKK